MNKKITTIFGWIFVAIGVLGFFNNPILGIFSVNTAHNMVHLLSGAIFLWIAYSAPGKCSNLLRIFGVVYLVVALLGFFSSGTILGLLTVSDADNWLHVVFALIFLWTGYMNGTSTNSAPTVPQM